jgi:hypothetical protein
VTCFHAGGAAVAGRFEALSIAMHTVGTIALGAGIALAGQIFNLSEHWPAAILLWAFGAALGWLLLGHWTQAAIVAILAPWWLAGEWIARHPGSHEVPVFAGLCALSFTYLSARNSDNDSTLRRALGWIGGLALLPSAALLADGGWERIQMTRFPSTAALAVAWAVAIGVPLAVSFLLRRREGVWAACFVVWTAGFGLCRGGIPAYLVCALGAAGLAAWGIREFRAERINLGIAGFAMTVFTFYFSEVMDKLGRSASLVAIGILLLGGGWLLERTRRRLMAQIVPEAS